MAGEGPLTRIRGTQDYYPAEFYARERAWRSIQKVFEDFGYQGIEVPIIEHTELHTRKSGEEIRRHMYHFIDLGERDICLRPEITASVVRAYNMEMSTESLPVRLYYIGPTFRYDKPQEGRYRQFTQAGIECIGGDGLEHDAEVIQIARLGLENMGISEYKCVIGHLGLIWEYLNGKKMLSDEQRLFFVEGFEDLSKAENMEAGIAQMRSNFRKTTSADSIPDSELDGVLEFVSELCSIKGKPPEVFEAISRVIDAHSSEGVTTGPLEELKKIAEYLDAYGVDWNNTSIDLGFGRGLAYYTGMIFQLHCPNLGAANQVCGGGRYDGLIEFMGGRDSVKAVGFAYGFERIVLSLQKSLPARQTGYAGKLEVPFAHAMVAAIGEEVQSYCIRLATELRKNGLRVELGSFSKKVRKLASRANTLDVPFVFFVGADEAGSNTVKYKRMETGDEKSCPFDDIPSVAREILASGGQITRP